MGQQRGYYGEVGGEDQMKRIFYATSSLIIVLASIFGWYRGPIYKESVSAYIEKRDRAAEIHEIAKCVNSKTEYLTVIGGKRVKDQPINGLMLYIAYNYSGAPKDEDTYFEREFRVIFSCVLAADPRWGLTLLMTQIERLPIMDIREFHYVGKVLLILGIRKDDLAGALNSPNLNEYISKQIQAGAVYAESVRDYGDIYVPIPDIDETGARLGIKREYGK